MPAGLTLVAAALCCVYKVFRSSDSSWADSMITPWLGWLVGSRAVQWLGLCCITHPWSSLGVRVHVLLVDSAMQQPKLPGLSNIPCRANCCSSCCCCQQGC